MSTRISWLVWFSILASALAMVSHLFFGSVFAASENRGQHEIIVRDLITLAEKKHELSGMVMAPSLCHELTARARDLDADTIVLVFEFWEQPYRDCTQKNTLRAFRIIAFAPPTIEFKGIINNTWTPVRVLRDIKES